MVGFLFVLRGTFNHFTKGLMVNPWEGRFGKCQQNRDGTIQMISTKYHSSLFFGSSNKIGLLNKLSLLL